MLAASNELERKLEFLKRWFGRVENQLSQPIHVHSLDDEAFDHILNKHQVFEFNLSDESRSSQKCSFRLHRSSLQLDNNVTFFK